MDPLKHRKYSEQANKGIRAALKGRKKEKEGTKERRQIENKYQDGRFKAKQ